MGQYYKIINIDTRQKLEPFDYDNGMKLTEWSYDRNLMVLAMMNLLREEWKGDRVYVVGDYADADDMTETWMQTYKDALESINSKDTLYHAAKDFERIAPADPAKRFKLEWKSPEREEPADIEDHGLRYIYNHATKQVIDLNDCPVEWEWEHEGKKEVTKFAPLPLLLAMGNGRGGGDYWPEKNRNLVGTWCETSQSVEVTAEPIADCLDYKVFKPDFTENEVPLCIKEL